MLWTACLFEMDSLPRYSFVSGISSADINQYSVFSNAFNQNIRTYNPNHSVLIRLTCGAWILEWQKCPDLFIQQNNLRRLCCVLVLHRTTNMQGTQLYNPLVTFAITVWYMWKTHCSLFFLLLFFYTHPSKIFRPYKSLLEPVIPGFLP